MKVSLRATYSHDAKAKKRISEMAIHREILIEP